jgi:hypothetical protein
MPGLILAANAKKISIFFSPALLSLFGIARTGRALSENYQMHELLTCVTMESAIFDEFAKSLFSVFTSPSSFTRYNG